MGLIVKRAQPPADAVRESVRTALRAAPPSDADMERRVSELTAQAQAQAKLELDPRRLLIAFALFAVLLALAILIDSQEWVKDPAPYIGLASTALGAVLGFVTGEASGSAGS